MKHAEVARASIVIGAEAKNPFLARIMAKQAQTLLENPDDEYNPDYDVSGMMKIVSDVISDMVNEAAEEMNAIADKHSKHSAEELLAQIFSQLSEE